MTSWQKLTDRERQVLIASGQGRTEREVAEHFGISPNTVRAHVENIKRKLGAHTKTHAVTLALMRNEITLREMRACA